MIVADREEIRVSETDDEILAFDVSDDALERTATIIGGQATPRNVGVWHFYRWELRLPRMKARKNFA